MHARTPPHPHLHPPAQDRCNYQTTREKHETWAFNGKALIWKFELPRRTGSSWQKMRAVKWHKKLRTSSGSAPFRTSKQPGNDAKTHFIQTPQNWTLKLAQWVRSAKELPWRKTAKTTTSNLRAKKINIQDVCAICKPKRTWEFEESRGIVRKFFTFPPGKRPWIYSHFAWFCLLVLNLVAFLHLTAHSPFCIPLLILAVSRAVSHAASSCSGCRTGARRNFSERAIVWNSCRW